MEWQEGADMHGKVSLQGRAGETLITEAGPPSVPGLRLRVGVG